MINFKCKKIDKGIWISVDELESALIRSTNLKKLNENLKNREFSEYYKGISDVFKEFLNVYKS